MTKDMIRVRYDNRGEVVVPRTTLSWASKNSDPNMIGSYV